jgi:hypothetical protein
MPRQVVADQGALLFLLRMLLLTVRAVGEHKIHLTYVALAYE